jgi:hypothetical protein
MNGSIGNLHTIQEKMFNSQRSVPIFEFRGLKPYLQLKGMEDFMSEVDKAIQDLHNSFTIPPGKKVGRQDSICNPPPDPEPVPTGPTKQLALVSSYVSGAPTLDRLFLTAGSMTARRSCSGKPPLCIVTKCRDKAEHRRRRHCAFVKESDLDPLLHQPCSRTTTVLDSNNILSQRFS